MKRAVVVVVGCAAGVALVLSGYTVGMNSKNTPQRGAPTDQERPKKSLATRNPAAANIVVAPTDLGFGVTGLKDPAGEQVKVGAAIEKHLPGLNRIFQQEVEKHPGLMGCLLLQLSVDSSGRVTDVKELAARLPDSDFRQAVLADVSKWTFPDIESDSLRINFPLLFVREGMDVGTLIQWEKALGAGGESAPSARDSEPPLEEAKAPASPQPSAAAPASNAKAGSATPKPPAARPRPDPSPTAVAGLYKLKYATAVRRQPGFESPQIGTVAEGAEVTVVSGRGDWLEIQEAEGTPSGFIRKEFVLPVEPE